MTLPTVTVLLDDGTGTFPLDVSTRVMAVDGYDITRGRDDWIGSVTAGEMTLTLNNSDGFFSDPGDGWDVDGWDTDQWGGAPLMSVDQQIRLLETVDGVTSFRFTGYIKSIPVSWPATVATFSTIQVTAVDLQARLERWTLRPMIDEQILLYGPTSYYTLGEVSGSTSAADSSGNQAATLVATGSGTPVAFGTDVSSVDGTTAATLSASGQFLQGTPTGLVLMPGTGWTFGLWVIIDAPPPSGEFIALAAALGSSSLVNLLVDDTGAVNGVGPDICDGAEHHLMTTQTAGTVTYYLDGASIGTAAFTSGDLTRLEVGSSGIAMAAPFTAWDVVTFPTALSTTEISQIYSVGKGLSESVADRAQRFADYTGTVLHLTDLSGDSVTAQPTSGKSAWDAFEEVIDTEGGELCADTTSALQGVGRAFQMSKTAPDLTLTSQWVTPDVQPTLDDQRLINYVEATAAGTGTTRIVRDVTSEATHGRYPETDSYLVATDDEALQRANWTVGKLAEPSPRYGTLTINLYGMTESLAAAVLDAMSEPGCWLRVTSMADQNPGGTTADVVVEGWQEHVDSSSWTIRCNVVDRSLFTALILDDPVYGALDAYPLGY